MSETLAHGYLSESTQRKLSNEYRQDGFQKPLSLCTLDKISLNVGRVGFNFNTQLPLLHKLFVSECVF